jgi:hypothetical protein
VENPEGNRTLGRPMRGWECNTKMNLKGVGWGHELDWSGSVQGQVAGTFKCGDDHSGSIKCGEFLD